MLTQEQLEARRRGVGGSDAAAICGLSRWRSPMDVYLDKIGALPPLEENEAMYWGSKLESAVGSRFIEEHPEFDVKLQPHEAPLWSDEHGFMCALPDGLCMDGKTPVAGLEIKTASAFKSAEWSDDGVPMEYLLQCQHYMAVTGLSRWYLAVLVGGQSYREYIIDRDPELIAMLIDREAAFWQLVEDRTPPAIDGSKASESVLNFLHPAEAVIEDVAQIPATIEIDGQETDAESLALMRMQIKAEIADGEKRLKLIDNTFKNLLGDHERGFAGQFELTWKARSRSGVDTKRLKSERPDVADEYATETAFRVFDIKEA